MHHLKTFAADQFIRSKTAAIRHGTIDADKGVVGIYDGNQVGNRIKGLFPLAFSTADSFINFLAILDNMPLAQ